MTILKTGDLLWVHKPLGNAYQIVEVKQAWISPDNLIVLDTKPDEASAYRLIITYYYYWRTNNTGKRINGTELTHCGHQHAVPYDKKLVLAHHQKAIDKINTANLVPTDASLKKINKIKECMEAVEAANF